MSGFDPLSLGFVRLRDFQIPGGVDVYEIRNHQFVDGNSDFLRINIYLSKDGDFVTIWNGLVEPFLAEAQFELPDSMKDFSFEDAYREPLFRGYIEKNDTAEIILNALRLKNCSLPQVLKGAPHDLRCELLPSAPPLGAPHPTLK